MTMRDQMTTRDKLIEDAMRARHARVILTDEDFIRVVLDTTIPLVTEAIAEAIETKRINFDGRVMPVDVAVATAREWRPTR